MDTAPQGPNEEERATRDAATLQAEALQRPRLLELEFQQMMDRLSVSGPTERELTDEEIVGEATFLVVMLILLSI
ncbi:hypothetical protein FRC10_005713 [Ceratobasidium sp. 414]|nr:hypothetical protein FRC10_005713 [Ceratobasidium sp. 414]